jgi:hypothetical protein
MDRIGREAGDLATELSEVLDKVANGTMAARDAWDTYFRVLARSEEIFREYLMILGGLALRDSMVDELTCTFADELIRECAVSVGRPTSFTIPAIDDTMSSTLRRVARIAFPDLNVWTLPMVAHEYGHIVLRETQLEKLVLEMAADNLKATAVASISQLRQLVLSNPNLEEFYTETLTKIEDSVGGAPDALLQLATNMGLLKEADLSTKIRAASEEMRQLAEATVSRCRVLIADAFATYTCGPAYAGAAILLRLNPAGMGTQDRPSDASRAVAILSILDAMGSDSVDGKKFGETPAVLRKAWDISLASAQSQVTPGAASWFEDDATRVLQRIRFFISNRKAEYGDKNWEDAKDLANNWRKHILHAAELADDPNKGLRDVLNGAWLVRSQFLSELETNDLDAAMRRLTKLANDYCKTRVLAQSDPDSGSNVFLRRSQRPANG